MNRLRSRIVILLLLAVIALSGAVLGFIPTSEQDSSPSSTNAQYLISSQPGIYRVTLERFKRHGPEVVEKSPYSLEHSTQVLRYRIAGDGSVVALSHTVSSKDGQNRYTMEPNGDLWEVTDLNSGEKTTGYAIPSIGSSTSSQIPQNESETNLSTTLASKGMTLKSKSVWGNRNVEVYEAAIANNGQLTAPGSDDPLGFPVIYDLSPVSQKAGVYVDIETGIVIRTYRYVINSLGDETLVESLEILSIEREN